MIPVTLPVWHGSLNLMNVGLILSWFVFSFLFWRGLRRWGVDEDRIFDLTFYASIVAFVTGRLGYVFTHPEIFAGKSVLLIAALWISPGLSFLGGLVGGLATLVLLSRSYKVRLGLVLDTLAVSLPLPIIMGEVNSLFFGLETGNPARVPWAIRQGTDTVFRHPVQFYEMLAVLCIALIISRISAVAVRKKWSYGIVGVWFFLLYSVAGFMLEFLKAGRVYWGQLHANQWILIGIFAECIGVLYIRGGRELTRPVALRIRNALGGLRRRTYEFVSRRNTHGTEKTS